ncbi:Sodium channel protein Nach [Cyphomyrmex costatus]|uniref:Sodium channel protein Nach n=1 Tax=Cyphomyrmex costatus TaxID=456900 RepID=A0A195CB46_9HYME|nr:Sodium channel protein Nach [Cyphomyrmex costatus]
MDRDTFPSYDEEKNISMKITWRSNAQERCKDHEADTKEGTYDRKGRGMKDGRHYVSIVVSEEDAPTSIDIESMHYETSHLSFPSVTLCPNDRVDWNRILEVESKFFPNGKDKASLETFRKILSKLSMMSFGDFDQLNFLKNQSVHSLAGINITQVLLEVMPRCDQLLSSCWWRNANRNCCEIFQVQKTEYGFCYSFNSEVAQTPPADPTESRPRRASGYGDWSGIRVTIHLRSVMRPPDSGKSNANIQYFTLARLLNDLYDLYKPYAIAYI